MEVIVVGVDGSENSKAALEFAAKEAGLRNAKLRVVSAWQFPNLLLAEAAVVDPDLQKGFKQAAQDIANEACKEAQMIARHVPCEIKVIEGQAAEAILSQSKDAAMIVVGSRGHGGFTGLLLGSVSQQVVHHAKCPVVVVPLTKKEEEQKGE